MPSADLGSNVESFLNAAGEFFTHLSEIDWAPFALALGFLAAMQVARAWAWRNVLRAAYPAQRIPYLPLAAAYRLLDLVTFFTGLGCTSVGFNIEEQEGSQRAVVDENAAYRFWRRLN